MAAPAMIVSVSVVDEELWMVALWAPLRVDYDAKFFVCFFYCLVG